MRLDAKTKNSKIYSKTLIFGTSQISKSYFLEIDGLLIKTFSDWVEILKSVGSKLVMLKFETNYC